jgi:FlaA1/EpsC-like NDP-sugar epimerase
MNKCSNVIIYGAGASGIMIKQLYDNKERGSVIAFIDDNLSLHNRTLAGVKIIHSSFLSKDFIKDNSIESIILSNIYIHLNKSSILAEFNLPILLPKDVREWNDGYVSLVDILEIDSSFIINRNSLKDLDSDSIIQLQGKKIVVTGASGSIGSEIARQLSVISKIQLILIDIDESGLHDLYDSLESKQDCSFHVCDVSNFTELERVFSKFDCIDSVFHAAAYKHVPIVEIDPYPAIRVNVLGTLNLCKLVEKNSIRDFTLVSTDKAVNPTNIMGVTKRCAEIITTYYNYTYDNLFRCTRFGNVVGSRGSAIPKFIEQIKKGGPITLTHSDMTRYFMTIPEATQLVIKSSTIKNNGGILLFDMGAPIKLIEIIANLKNYYNASDVKTEYIGLRKGEKMYEELSMSSEDLTPTSDSKINIIISDKPSEDLINEIYEFLNNYEKLDVNEIRSDLKKIIPEYNISNN